MFLILWKHAEKNTSIVKFDCIDIYGTPCRLLSQSNPISYRALFDEAWALLKKVLQNSVKRFWIPEVMDFDSLVSIKSEKGAPVRKITKTILKRWFCSINSNIFHMNQKIVLHKLCLIKFSFWSILKKKQDLKYLKSYACAKKTLKY